MRHRLPKSRPHRFMPSARARLLLCILATLTVQSALAQSANDAQTEIEEVVVEGWHPGPRLWKLNKDGHVLWILGTLSPLPQRMEWRSREVEDVLSRAQAVIEPESIDLDANILERRSIRRTLTNPGQATLDTVLPPELYARWSQMKQAYLPRNRRVEGMQPIVAAQALLAAAVGHAGLANSDRIQAEVRRLARKRRIKPVSPTMTYKTEYMRKLIGEVFLQMPVDAQIACLDQVLTVIKAEIDITRQRANAWAIGDVEALKRLPTPQSIAGNACFGDSPKGPESIRLSEEMRNLWFETIDAAVAQNAETLAVLPVDKLLRDDGRLKILVSRGYVLESAEAEPKAASSSQN